MTRRDAAGVLCVFVALGAVLLYRHFGVEPRRWGAVCAGPDAPAACLPRAALLWGQHWQLWGGGALALGLWAFVRRAGVGGCAAAVALGAAAVANHNATWGMVGAALGAWAWIGHAGSRGGMEAGAARARRRTRTGRDSGRATP